MKLSELMIQVENEEAREEFNAQREEKIKELEERIVELRKQIVPDTLFEVLCNLKEQTKALAEEKGFTRLRKEHEFDIYSTDEEIFALHYEPDKYVLVRAKENTPLSKKQIIRTALAENHPKNYKFNSEVASVGMMSPLLTGAGSVVGYAAITDTVATLTTQMCLGFAGGIISLAGIALGSALILEIHKSISGKRSKKRYPKIQEYLEVYQGIEAVKQLEEM